MSTDAPPSYDAVMQSILKRIGPNPTAKNVLKVVQALPQSEKAILAAHPIEVSPMTHEEQKNFSLGIAESMSSEEGENSIVEEANQTNRAVLNINRTFALLSQQLSGLDARYTSPQSGPFHPRLRAINNLRMNLILS